jgi:hypothetical protein
MATRGRPTFVPSAEQRMRVEIMVGCGMSQELICQQTINTSTGLPIDSKTLRKVFKNELENGVYAANSLVAQALFKKATGTGPQSVTAAIFWMKARAGWKDKTHIELNGNVGDKPTSEPVGDLSDEQLAEELRKNGIDPAGV